MIEANLNTVGLIFDIAGAFLLAKSIIWKSNRNINQESNAFWNKNVYEAKDKYQSREFGWIGFVFLFAGFVGQGIGQFLPNFKIDFKIVVLIIAFLFFWVITLSIWSEKYFSKKYLNSKED